MGIHGDIVTLDMTFIYIYGIRSSKNICKPCSSAERCWKDNIIIFAIICSIILEIPCQEDKVFKMLCLHTLTHTQTNHEQFGKQRSHIDCNIDGFAKQPREWWGATREKSPFFSCQHLGQFA